MVCVSAPLEFCKFVCGLISTCRVQKCAVRKGIFAMARPNPSVFSEHLKRNMNHGSGFLTSDFGFFFFILYMFIYIRCATVILCTSCELFFFCEPWGQERVIMSLHCGLKRPTLHEVAWYHSHFTWPLGSLCEIPTWWLCVSVSFPSKAQWYPQWRQSIS